MKLEIGKTYVDGYGRLVRIICVDRMSHIKKPVIGLSRWNNKQAVEEPQFYTTSGSACSNYDKKQDIVKEWKEPVTHRRDVVWYKNGLGGIYVDTYLEGQTFGEHVTILKRQTVEYTEE